MSQKVIPLSRPEHPEDPAALLETLRTVLISERWTEGEFAASFERRVAEVCGVVYAISTHSGASALELICHAIGLNADSEVICPSYTYIGMINAILSAGACPVFADIAPDAFSLDLRDVEQKVTKKTRAVLLTHQFGIPSNGKLFAEFCGSHDLALIEDGSCGLGSTFEGKSICTFGQVGILSFHPRQVLSSSEGGMLLTDDEALANRARSLGGQTSTASQGYRMSEFQAALGLWALDRLEEGMARRQARAKRYDETLSSLNGVKIVSKSGESQWSRQNYALRVPGDRRDLIANALRRDGIETGPGPQPAHLHKYIEHRLHPPRLPHTEAAYEETLLLPLYSALTDADQTRIISSVTRALSLKL